MNVQTKSQFIPTPGITEVSNYYLVQLMMQDRVRAIITGDVFVDNSQLYVHKYLNIPTTLETAAQIDKWVKQEAKSVSAAFHKYEETSIYKDALMAIKQMEGHSFQIVDTTNSGIMVLIEVPGI